MEQQTSRSCGGCTACCFTHKIDALSKPLATACPNCSSAGCAIYGSHPAECKEYKCFWLLVPFPEEWRPDKLGVVIDAWPGTAPLVRVWEVSPGASAQPAVLAIIGAMKQSGQVALVRRLNSAGTYDNELINPFDDPNDPRFAALRAQIEADRDSYKASRA